jgi:rhomboid protease GluP
VSEAETEAEAAAEAPAEVAPGPETTTQYLARSFCADQGYVLGTVAEAAPLVAASTIVLTKGDGINFSVLCLVDRERDPAASFGLALADVALAGEACARYTGTVSGQKVPVQIQIWEVGHGAPDMARLETLSRRWPGKAHVGVQAFGVDVDTGKVRSTAPSNGLFAGRRYVEKLLAAPRRSFAELAAASVRTPASEIRGVPVVTIGLLALLALLFAAEIVFGTRPTTGFLEPDITTLVAMGGVSKTLVQDGEWWRFFTCAFLHGSLIHLVLNGVALLLAGVVLESVLGRAWLLALFTIGALGGSAMSYLVNDANVVSVGASGAIMGLLAAAFVATMRLPEHGGRTGMQMMLARVLIPSLLPLAFHGEGGGSVDYGAHFGGAIVGGLAGVLLLVTWAPGSLHPRFGGVARGLVVAGAAFFALGFFQVHAKYPRWADEAKSADLVDQMAPQQQLEALSDAELGERIADLTKQYPRDPRLHYILAAKLAKEEHLDEAAAELRLALADPDVLKRVYKPELEVAIRAMLAEILVYQKKPDEAAAAAAPACTLGEGGKVPPDLERLSLCPGGTGSTPSTH